MINCYCPGSGAAVRVAERCGELTRGSGNSLPPRGQNLNAAVLGQDCLGQTAPWQGVLPPHRSPDGRLPLRLVPTAPIRPGGLSAPHSCSRAPSISASTRPVPPAKRHFPAQVHCHSAAPSLVSQQLPFGKYPPAKPGALELGPPKAVDGVADAAPEICTA